MIRFQSPVLPPVEDIAFSRSEATRRFANSGPCQDLLVERLEDGFGPHHLHCVPLSSGTNALRLGIAALAEPGRGARVEVLLPSFTFAAVVNAVLWAGLRPVFVDVDP